MAERELIHAFTVKVYEEYDKLTPEQQEQVDKGDKDPFLPFPSDQGIEDLEIHLGDIMPRALFNYLGKGRDAYSIEIE